MSKVRASLEENKDAILAAVPDELRAAGEQV
jgi:hypothetical protein